MTAKSVLQKHRASYEPKLPSALRGSVVVVEGAPTEAVADRDDIKKLFPATYGMPEVRFEPAPDGQGAVTAPFNVGVILSGGQAPGGHNVISGIFDGLKAINADNKLYGFLMGPDGLVNHDYVELTSETIDEYRNTGGFDIIGSGRTKLEKVEQFEAGKAICHQLGIKALIIIGGDDSNTNAALLADYYKRTNAGIQVIGCPKTIDGDLKNEQIETSFGFDTATKVYSEMIGNIQRDCNSAKKYWHFIKLMGRSASHIALECALQTQPNFTIISEEVEAKKRSLDDIVTDITNLVIERAKKKCSFGVILIPEGLIEFIPEMKKLIKELNDMLAKNLEFAALAPAEQREYVLARLTPESAQAFKGLPAGVARQLTLDRDPHGNVQVSLIETEKLLSELVADKIKCFNRLIDKLKNIGALEEDLHISHIKFSPQHHFFGYEGRCAAPSNFDADYCYSLGYNAAHLANSGLTGYMSSVRNLAKPAEQWMAGGIPITMMMNMEVRNRENKPVIRKALVELDGEPFKVFAAHRDVWAQQTCYMYPGPIQYFGPSEVCDATTRTLHYEQSGK